MKKNNKWELINDSTLWEHEAKELIGKQIREINADERKLVLYFTDGTRLTMLAQSYEDHLQLEIDYECK